MTRKRITRQVIHGLEILLNRAIPALDDAQEWMSPDELSALDSALRWADSNRVFPLPERYPFARATEREGGGA